MDAREIWLYILFSASSVCLLGWAFGGFCWGWRQWKESQAWNDEDESDDDDDGDSGDSSKAPTPFDIDPQKDPGDWWKHKQP
jgi:hypothetical protein